MNPDEINSARSALLQVAERLRQQVRLYLYGIKMRIFQN